MTNISLTQIPTSSQVDIKIHISSPINVSSIVARRKVNALLLDHVGTGVYANDPEMLVRDGRLYWRVPVLLALPTLGRLGQVGTIKVDVQTGEILADDTTWQELSDHAERLFAGATLQSE
jgi:hypothetical protein